MAEIEFITTLPAQITSANNKMIRGIRFYSGTTVSFSLLLLEGLSSGEFERNSKMIMLSINMDTLR